MRRKPEVRNWTYAPVVSYEDDVHAWMYLDQVDGVLRYEAYVVGYDDTGSPTTLEFVIEEGVFELSRFPQIFAFLPRALRQRLGGSADTEGRVDAPLPASARSGASAASKGAPDASGAGSGAGSGDGAAPSPSDTDAASASWNPALLKRHSPNPWDLAPWQWEGLHAFCEQQERRLKEECRLRWTRRLRALGYDVIRSL